MIKHIIRLISPGFFQRNISEDEVTPRDVLIRPIYGSICKADLRYYLGKRPQEILARKLPCALVHEACAQVVWDPVREYKPKQWVVPVPNTPDKADVSTIEGVTSNYLPTTRFRSSGFDGYTQDMLSHDRALLVPAPHRDDGYMKYVFSEIISVCVHALSRCEARLRTARSLGIWGDGVMGYVMSIVARQLYPDLRISSIIKHEARRPQFQHASRIFTSSNIPYNENYDVCIECVGGEQVQYVLDEILRHVAPGGCIILTGVTESSVPISTRGILEKGLGIIGSSRSVMSDYKLSVEFFQSRWFAGKIEQLIMDVVIVRNEVDLDKAFQAAAGLRYGRIVMEFRF